MMTSSRALNPSIPGLGGRGVPPSFMPQLLGRPAPRAFRRGEPIEL